jgi:predicted transcriptional regulator
MTKIGREKGLPKTPGSGRKKGTPNKSTLIKEDLSKVRTSEERHGEIMNKMWELAVFKDSTTAAKVWLEDYNNKLTCKLKMQMESFEEIDEAAKFILQQVLEGVVPISVGKSLLICSV